MFVKVILVRHKLVHSDVNTKPRKQDYWCIVRSKHTHCTNCGDPQVNQVRLQPPATAVVCQLNIRRNGQMKRYPNTRDLGDFFSRHFVVSFIVVEKSKSAE